MRANDVAETEGGMMRWKLGRYSLGGDRRSEWYVTGGGTFPEEVEVIPASASEEDVERVAGALAALDGDDCFSPDVELPGEAEVRALSRYTYTKQARAALAAFLDQPKGNT